MPIEASHGNRCQCQQCGYSYLQAIAVIKNHLMPTAKNLSKEKGINKLVATNITPNAFQVPGVGISRLFCKKYLRCQTGTGACNRKESVIIMW